MNERRQSAMSNSINNQSAPSLLLKAAMIQSDKRGKSSPSPTGIFPVPKSLPNKVEHVNVFASPPRNQSSLIPVSAPALSTRNPTTANSLGNEAVRQGPNLPNQRIPPSSQPLPPPNQGFPPRPPRPEHVCQQPFTSPLPAVSSHIAIAHQTGPPLIAPRPTALAASAPVKSNSMHVPATPKQAPLSTAVIPTGRTFDGKEVRLILEVVEKHCAEVKENTNNEVRDLRYYLDEKLEEIKQLLQIHRPIAGPGEIIMNGTQPHGSCHFNVHAGGVIAIGSSDENLNKKAICEKAALAAEKYKMNHMGDYKPGYQSNETCSSSDTSDDEEENEAAFDNSNTPRNTGTSEGGAGRAYANNSSSYEDDDEIQQAATRNGGDRQGMLGRRVRSAASASRASKRKRDNWTEAENFKFMKVVISNPELEEMELRRLLAKTFSPRRTHEQCANHLRILRAQGKLPQAKEEPQTPRGS